MIEHSDLEFYERLGGGTAAVYRGRWKSEDTVVAVKRMLELTNREVEMLFMHSLNLNGVVLLYNFGGFFNLWRQFIIFRAKSSFLHRHSICGQEHSSYYFFVTVSNFATGNTFWCHFCSKYTVRIFTIDAEIRNTFTTFVWDAASPQTGRHLTRIGRFLPKSAGFVRTCVPKSQKMVQFCSRIFLSFV